MVDVCSEVLDRLTDISEEIENADGHGVDFGGAEIVVVPVEANNRFSKLDDGSIDILCGPNSITPKRLSRYIFTFPLFLSGISYATLRDFSETEYHEEPDEIVGMVKDTTALEGMTPLLNSGIFGRHNELIAQSSREGEIELWIRRYANHSDGITDLCEREIYYYVADIDILRTRLDAIEDCDVVLSRKTYTREIYGIALSATRFSGWPEDAHRVASLYTQLNHHLFEVIQTGALDRLFDENFGNYRKSEELAHFFASLVIEIKN